MPRAEPYGVFRAKSILFGDDYWATILDEEPPYKNHKGVWMKRYLIVPSPQLMKAYPELQKPGVLTYKNYAKWVEYPKYWVVDENPSRNWAVAHIFCGYDGRETPLTKKYDEYTTEIRMLEQENENLKISNLQLIEENKQLLGEMVETAKRVKEFEEVFNSKQGGERDEQDIPPEN